MTDPAYYLVQSEITRSAFESGPDAIIVVNDGGLIVAVNAQAELLTGKPRAALIGEPVETLVPNKLRDRHLDHRAGYLRKPHRRLMGPNLDLSIIQHSVNGDQEIPVEVNLAPSVISTGTIVVATIRTSGGWSSTSTSMK